MLHASTSSSPWPGSILTVLAMRLTQRPCREEQRDREHPPGGGARVGQQAEGRFTLDSPSLSPSFPLFLRVCIYSVADLMSPATTLHVLG